MLRYEVPAEIMDPFVCDIGQVPILASQYGFGKSDDTSEISGNIDTEFCDHAT